jgi:hypothetical protein
MKKINLAHEVFNPYLLAVRVSDLVYSLAETERHSMNERLINHAHSLLEHAGCASTERSKPAQARRIQYARLALTKLATIVDAAKRMKLITVADAAEVRVELLRLEEMLEAHPANASETKAPQSKESDQRDTTNPVTAAEPLPSEAILELQELIERDRRPPPSPTVAADRGPPG